MATFPNCDPTPQHHAPQPFTAHVATGETSKAPLPILIQRDLRQLLAQPPGSSQTLQELLKLTAHYTSSPFVAYYRVEQEECTPLAVCGQFQSPDRACRADEFIAVCRQSVQRGHVTNRCLSREQQLFAVAVPVASQERIPTVLAALLTPSKSGLTTHLATLDRMAAAIVEWRLSEALGRLDWEAHTSAAATELCSRIEVSKSPLEAAFLTVNELRAFFECSQVALGRRRATGVGCRLQAISGMADFDRNSESAERLTAAMDECLVREVATVWPPLQAGQRHATLAHRKLADQAREEAILSVPLNTIDEKPWGVVTLTGSRQVLHGERSPAALQAFAPHIATALELRQRAEPGWFERLRAWAGRGARGRKWAVGGAIALVLLLPLVPWRYRVTTECQVEPVVRRFCVAPYAGILMTTLVQPGDIVTTDQPLARMDDRELRWELSSTMAELSRARTKRDQAMDDHDTSEAKLAELEMERLDLKIRLFKNREQQLEIASPLDGVVLKGDLEDAEGAPVKAGQTLFEIAPLHPIKLELAIGEEDLPSVRDGQSIAAHLDGYRGEAIRGTIGKIHPRSEIRDSQNVFVAEVQLDNPASALRPGMSGRAKIMAGFRPLGWIWFHKAWHRARTIFGV